MGPAACAQRSARADATEQCCKLEEHSRVEDAKAESSVTLLSSMAISLPPASSSVRAGDVVLGRFGKNAFWPALASEISRTSKLVYGPFVLSKVCGFVIPGVWLLLCTVGLKTLGFA